MSQHIYSMEERTSQANRVTWLSVVVNTVLTLMKFVAGLLGHSSALVADALHSASDFATDFAVLVGMRLARRPQDGDHPYGHGKYETLAAVIVGVALAAVGICISFHAGHTLVEAWWWGTYPSRPTLFALWAAIVSIVVKEALYQVTVRVARETKNDALLANAWHHRSDALSSIGTAVGAGVAACFGGAWVLFDAIAAAFVGVVLLKIAWEIVRDSLDKLMEQGMSLEETAQIFELVHAVPGISEPHHLRSRRVGTVAVIELHFRVDPEMTVREGHGLASQVEQHLRVAFGHDAIVTVHVEPLKTSRASERISS
jgi:cation diffusion facilitator family transporter